MPKVKKETKVEKKVEDGSQASVKDLELLTKSLQKLNKSLNGVDVETLTNFIQKTVKTTTSGTYAEREHLDNQIADITNRQTPFLDRVARTRANGITHEWDMVTSLGSNETAVAECGTPNANEATITRYSAQVKTFATRVEVCDKAQWGASDYVDLKNLHLERGMRKIVQDIEKKSFYGDADTTAAEFDGLYQIITDYASDNLVNGAGASITEAKINSAIQTVLDQGGMVSHMFMASDDLRDWSDLWASKVTYNDPTGGMTTGYNIANYMSFAGNIQIVMDLFITDSNSPNTYGDVFLLNMSEVALAQTEPMYKLPTYRGLTLAETETVVWNCVLECRIPQWQSIVYNVN